MPLRLLLAPHERVQLRPQERDDAQLESEGEADRGPARLQQQLLNLTPDPLCRQVVERDAAAEGTRAGVDRELEAGEELQRAEHPEAVVAERRRVHHLQPAGGQVVTSSARIVVRVVARIPRNRIDREVAAAGGVGERHPRVAVHGEAFVPTPALRLAAGQRDIDGTKLVHGEALAHRLDAAEGGEQCGHLALGHAVQLDVDLARGLPEQAIAHVATDDEGAATAARRGVGDRTRERERVVGCRRGRVVHHFILPHRPGPLRLVPVVAW